MTDELLKARVECSCPTCQSYCHHAVGWFLPSEIAAAAASLSMTEEEFFAQHCTVDYWAGDTVFVIRPRKVDEAGGEMTTFDPRGRCAHLSKANRCGIHTVKPYECAVTRHDLDASRLHEAVANAWRTDEAQALIQRLLGRTPTEPESDFGDLMSLMF